MNENIPEGWEVVPIGNATKFSQGIQVDVGQHYELEDDSKVRFVRISDYTKSDETPRYVDKSLAIKGIVDKNDIVMIRYGEAGRVCRGIVGAIANNLFTIKPNHYLEKEFLFQTLSSNEISKKISELAASSAMPAISFSSLRTIELKVPPLPEQKKIASILTSVDEVIEKTQSQIDKLQDLKKGTMNELLTKGIGHTEFKDSELGRIPKSWEVVPIGNTTKFSQGIQVDVEQHYEREDDSKVRFIRISDYTKSDETPRYVDKSLAIKGIVEKNDVVMIRYGEAGRVCRGIVGAIANNLFTIKPNHYLEKEFLFQILSSNEISNKISELAASSAMPAISFSSLQTIKLKIPPIDEQLEISDVILSIDTKIDVQKQKLHQTQSLKKSLMQDLLTGKVRVSVN